MAIHKIKVEVTGAEEDKELALAGLLETMEYCDIRSAISTISLESLTQLAKATHGIMYKTLYELNQ